MLTEILRRLGKDKVRDTRIRIVEVGGVFLRASASICASLGRV